MSYFFSYSETPIGLLQVRANDNGILSILFVEEKEDEVDENIYSQKGIEQIQEYFDKTREVFDLPLILDGTAFQQSVWKKVTEVPFGKSLSYIQIANKINNVGSVRAVGVANGKNQFAIVIPCHRIIASNGKLTGYAWGLWRKEWLLKHEGFLTQTKMF